MNYANITLGELLSSENQAIKRNAIGILKQMQKGYKKRYFLINDDIGKSGKLVFGEWVSFKDILGKVMKQDVGKMMVKQESGIWQVENDEQFNLRLTR